MTGFFSTEYLTEDQRTIARLVAYLSEQKDRQFTTLADLSRDTSTPPHVILAIFEDRGIRYADASAPSNYEIETIIEALQRHETSARYNRGLS